MGKFVFEFNYIVNYFLHYFIPGSHPTVTTVADAAVTREIGGAGSSSRVVRFDRSPLEMYVVLCVPCSVSLGGLAATVRPCYCDNYCRHAVDCETALAYFFCFSCVYCIFFIALACAVAMITWINFV